jgi:hypothetical protein
MPIQSDSANAQPCRPLAEILVTTPTPNTRLQRTRLRAQLSRKSFSVDPHGCHHVTFRHS